MSRRTRKELAAENAVLFGKLEQVRDDLDEFLDDSNDEEAEDEAEDEDDEESEGDVADGPVANLEDKED
jgi:hypothetical protein